MSRKAILLLVVPALLALADTSGAQNLVEFLGPKYNKAIKLSPKYRIPYGDNGLNRPLEHRSKKAKKRGAPTSVLDAIRDFPGSPDAIGDWIDEAFDEAVASFSKCGGALARLARVVSPASLLGGVTIESTIWFEPALDSFLAGGYYPSTRSIRVVGIYYGTTGDYRHAKSLLVWEMKNHLGTLAGIESEPFSPDWPCDAR